MPILAAELEFYASLVISDEDVNGGFIDYDTLIQSAIRHALFPPVRNTQRVAGLTRYRKEFLKNSNDENRILYETRIFIGRRTPAQDYIQIHIGTNIDTQAQSKLYTDWLGTGILQDNITAGVTLSFDVLYDTTSGVIDGGLVYLTDGINEEFLEIEEIGGVSWVGNTATITVKEASDYSFPSLSTIVASVIDYGDLVASYSNWSETNIHDGTYDESTYPLVVYNVGTVEDEWTLTFTGPGAFSVSGLRTGFIGTGTTSNGFQPVNGSSYYFKLEKEGWADTWDVGDSINFKTHHAAVPIWVKEVVPAGIDDYYGNDPRIHVYGESA